MKNGFSYAVALLAITSSICITGCHDGTVEAYDDGYQEGRESGYKAGYEDGIYDGQSEIENKPERYGYYTEDDLTEAYDTGFADCMEEYGIK